MKLTLSDCELTNRINKLVRDRIVEARHRGALLTSCCCPSACDHDRAEKQVLLWGPDGMVRIVCTEGASRLEFSSFTMPAYTISCKPAQAEISIHFTGSPDAWPLINERLTFAESLPVGPNCRVPYGFVKNGLVVAILWCGHMHVERDGRRLSGLDSYVLEGKRLPIELFAAPGFMPGEWQERFWRMVENGLLVRLSERIVQLPGEMWMFGNDTNQPTLLFDAVDDQMPAIAAGVPYHFWHITEGERGERDFGERYPGKGAYKFALRRKFN